MKDGLSPSSSMSITVNDAVTKLPFLTGSGLIPSVSLPVRAAWPSPGWAPVACASQKSFYLGLKTSVVSSDSCLCILCTSSPVAKGKCNHLPE